jgi:ABC-type lipoprotein release transport system permease subunit
MFGTIIESYSGYIQIQNDEFWENRIVDNVFEATDDLNQILINDENVKESVPRFESFALASSGPRTKGVLVMGIDPVKENLLSDVKNKLVIYRLTPDAIENLLKEDIPETIKQNLQLFEGSSYSNDGRLQIELGIKDKDVETVMPHIIKFASVKNDYIKMGEPGALVGSRLAQYLGLEKGDTIVLLGQGYHGTTAAGKYVIKGLVKIPSPDIDNKIIYLPVDICQDLYYAYGMLTSMVLDIDDKDDKSVNKTIARLGSELEEQYRVLGWKEINETIVQQMEADDKGGQIMIGILYMVIAFGVFGTVLMMTAERRREFGVLIAIGMQKSKMTAVIIIEMLYIGLLGILMGVSIAIPAIIRGYYHPIKFSGEMAKMFEDYGFEPIMKFQGIDTYFLWQSLIVAIIVILAVIYPIRKIRKLKVINAIKA